MRALFICRANAGRSQIAEAFYNDMTGTKDASSAGVDLLNSSMKENLAVPQRPIDTMREVGIDISNARRKWLTEEMVDAADVAVALLEEHECSLPDYLTGSPKFVRWDDVPDAKGTDAEFHRETREKIRAKVEALIKKTRP